MPWTHAFFPEHRMIYSRMWGAVNAADMLAAQQALGADTRFDPTHSHILDVRDGDPSALNGMDISQLANRTIFAPSALRAIVVSGDLQFGLARMYEIRRELVGASGQIHVFRALEEALAWLGVADLDIPRESS